MAQSFIGSAAYALSKAFAFAQRSYRSDAKPVVVIPREAWSDFLTAFKVEMTPVEAAMVPASPYGWFDGFTVEGIRFEPAPLVKHKFTRPTPLEDEAEWAELAEDWVHVIDRGRQPAMLPA